MLNKPTYGSQPIKNEQSGTTENNFSKSNVIICVCPKCSGQGIVSKPPYVPGDVDQCSSSSCAFVCDLCNGTKVFITSHYYTELSRILTAAKVSTVDEVVQMLEHQPLSDEDIERAAKEYAENENSAYTNDYYGFIAGANFAKQPIANEWVKVEDVKKYLTEQEKHSLEMCKVAKENRDIFLEGISTGECVAFSLVSAFITSTT